MNFRTLMKQPSAYLPIGMSAAILVMFGVITLVSGVPKPEPDEGAAAHIFQLLMVWQVPFILFFAFRWLLGSVKPALLVLLLQVTAAIAALAPVFLLHL
jgi:hypothetical protein